MNIHPTYRYPNGLDEGPPRAAGHPAGARRGLWRRCLWGLAGLLVLLLVVGLAWVVSNWHDAPAQPRPAALAQPLPRLAAERNVAYALLGLQAAPDRDAATVGKALWAASEQGVQQLLAEPDPRLREDWMKARAAASSAVLGATLSPPQTAVWNCDELAADCLKAGLEKPEALAQQRQAAAALGARCDAVVDALQPDKGSAFEELLPAQWHPAAGPGPFANWAVCPRWWHTGALLAYRQGRKDEAWRQMTRSNHYHRALLAGAHSLIAHSLLNTFWRRHLFWITALAAQDPASAALALPLVQTLGAPEQWVRRWMVVEAAFGQAVLKDLQRSAGPWDGATDGALLGDLSDWLARLGIGWHPERTAQLMDQQWLTMIKAVDAGLPQVLAGLQAGSIFGTQGPLRWWRNPMGRMMVEMTRPAHKDYLRRHLDLELHREAAALALNVHRLGITPAARAAWAQQQSLSAALRDRLAWSVDGHTLSVRSWGNESATAPALADPRRRIEITLDKAPVG